MERGVKSIPHGLYTDDEIAASYRRASNKKVQLKVLAELNSCSSDEIEEIIDRYYAGVRGGARSREMIHSLREQT